jgi:hypothetical protein
MSGGGGTGVSSNFGGVCSEGPNHSEDRAALYHAVEIAVTEAGRMRGRILPALDRAGGKPRRFDAP